MLKTRVITALVLVSLIILILGFGGPFAWSAFVAVMIILGLWEWGRLAMLPMPQQFIFAGLGGALLVTVAFLTNSFQQTLPWLIGSALFWITLGPYTLKNVGGDWLSKPLLLLPVAILLLGATGASLIIAREQGFSYLFSLFALVWIADIAAYFCGKAFGKRKLAPRISPGKSWEGAWGGVLGGVAYGWAWIAVANQFPALGRKFF